MEELGPDATPEQRREAELKVRQNAPTARSYYDVTFSVPKSLQPAARGLPDRGRALRDAGDLEGASAAAAKADEVWECRDGRRPGRAGIPAGRGRIRPRRPARRQGSRTGSPTGRQVDAHRWTVASFRQHTSRDNDPQMHVHNAIWNRVQATSTDPVTGETRSKWLTIDGQEIYRHTKAAGHIFEKTMDEALYRKRASAPRCARTAWPARSSVSPRRRATSTAPPPDHHEEDG